MNLIQRMISVLLYNGHASKRVCKKIVEHMEEWLICRRNFVRTHINSCGRVYNVFHSIQSLHRAGQLQELPFQCEQSSKV